MNAVTNQTRRFIESIGSQPVRKAVRRLRWFKSSFGAQVDSVSLATGIEFEIDRQKLTKCFVDWIEKFERSRPGDAEDRRAFVGYSSGLMLQQLVERDPVTVVTSPRTYDGADPAYFWPAGYVYVQYCLRVRQAVLEQEFHEETSTSPKLTDLRTWWSFRENVNELSSYAIPFLDMFAGDDPDWQLPGIFQSARMRAVGTRFSNQSRLSDG